MMEEFGKCLSETNSDLTPKGVSEIAERVSKKHEKKVSSIYYTARHFVTGSNAGGAAPHTMQALGGKTCYERIKKALSQIEAI